MQATQFPGGDLIPLANCYIIIPTQGLTTAQCTINFKSLPDISDTKSVDYKDEPIIGRAQPLKSYSSSGARSISMEFYFNVVTAADPAKNLQALRLIQSAAYPQAGSSRRVVTGPVLAPQGAYTVFATPFNPPPVCKLRCGQLLSTSSGFGIGAGSGFGQLGGINTNSGAGDLCVVLKRYSVKFPRDVVWDDITYCPWQFQVSTEWETVYLNNDLPGQFRIYQSGR